MSEIGTQMVVVVLLWTSREEKTHMVQWVYNKLIHNDPLSN